MRPAERQTRSHLMRTFEERGFHPRSDLGQNFLIDLNLLEFVVRQAELQPDDVVLEIGTGTGGMTTYLASQAGHVVSVEVDHRVHALAQQATEGYSNITLLNCDALKNKNRFQPAVVEAVQTALQELPSRSLKLVANLPYCIATPVVTNLIASDLPWTRMVITIQWELAERMRAEPNTNDYGALSIWLQSQAEVKTLKKLGPTVFWPRPRVDSAVVLLVRDPVRQAELGDRRFFQDFLRRLFHLRRKALRNVLAGMYRKQLNKAELDGVLQPFGFPNGQRADTLSVAQLIALSKSVHAALIATGHAPSGGSSDEEAIESDDSEPGEDLDSTDDRQSAGEDASARAADPLDACDESSSEA